jgi:hypothetical protein
VHAAYPAMCTACLAPSACLLGTPASRHRYKHAGDEWVELARARTELSLSTNPVRGLSSARTNKRPPCESISPSPRSLTLRATRGHIGSHTSHPIACRVALSDTASRHGWIGNRVSRARQRRREEGRTRAGRAVEVRRAHGAAATERSTAQLIEAEVVGCSPRVLGRSCMVERACVALPHPARVRLWLSGRCAALPQRALAPFSRRHWVVALQ